MTMNDIIFNRQIDTDNQYAAGESVWAWRNGDFVRATIIAVDDSSASSDSKLPVYQVSFADSGEQEEKLIASLIRKDSSEKPDMIPTHEWHVHRRKAILQAHPEIRKLRPLPKPVYISMMIVLIVLHLGAGAAITMYSDTSFIWLWTIVLAATAGAFFAYAMQQLTHECCHSPYRSLNSGPVLLADFMTGTTGPTSFYLYYYHAHIKHHANTGYDSDPDVRFHGHWAIPPKWLARSRIGRLTWLTLFSLFTCEILIIEHVMGRLPQPRMRLNNKSLIVTLAGKYAFMALTFWFGGFWCFLYFRLAAGFSLGAFGHPYAGFWLMQHAAKIHNGFQPTLSYSGSRLWHWLTLGELYHVEHHDFPWIPFTKISKVSQMAPEFYQPLYTVPSIRRLIWAWISHTDGSPWMDVAGALDCVGPLPQGDNRRRPTPPMHYNVS